jgi:hypothetical protein
VWAGMNARFHQNDTDDIELVLKRAELASLRARHTAARAVLQQLRDDIASFERTYDQTLGRRIAELESIEAEISRLSGYSNRESEPDEGYEDEDEDDSFSQAAAPPVKPVWRSEARDIKALYREVAKAVHPDLADGVSAKLDRHELMSKANRAYAEDDHGTLQEILRNWGRTSLQYGEGAVRSEISRLVAQIAKESQDLRSVNAKVEELKGSYVCRFKMRVDANLAMGGDLFADMVDAADINIERALRRLAALTGEKQREFAQREQKERRNICFPAGISCGVLYLRDRASISYSQWKTLGHARGCLEVDIDQSVRLDIKDQAGVKLSYLQELKPDDLQSLFLYEIGDMDLDGIAHLTGLEELYLSGARLTDAALGRILPLINLKRIYLYHTDITDNVLVHLARFPALQGLTSSGNSITDEGLAVFKRAIPGLKTVSFQWKR